MKNELATFSPEKISVEHVNDDQMRISLVIKNGAITPEKLCLLLNFLGSGQPARVLDVVSELFFRAYTDPHYKIQRKHEEQFEELHKFLNNLWLAEKGKEAA